jgi:hypothetical protein
VTFLAGLVWMLEYYSLVETPNFFGIYLFLTLDDWPI